MQRKSNRMEHIQNLIGRQKRRLDNRDVGQAIKLGYSLDIVRRMSVDEKRLRLAALVDKVPTQHTFISGGIGGRINSSISPTPLDTKP